MREEETLKGELPRSYHGSIYSKSILRGDPHPIPRLGSGTAVGKISHNQVVSLKYALIILL